MQSNSINFDDTKTAFVHKSTKDLRRSHFVFSSMGMPWMVTLGTNLTRLALHLKLPVKGIVKKTLFDQFCGGESIVDCEHTITTLGRQNVHTILDYSVEGLESEDGYDAVKREALKIVEHAAGNDNIPFCVIKLSGLGSTELMTKAQSDEKLSELEKTKLYYCEQRVIEIAEKVAENGLKLMIDAEESWFQNFVDGVAFRLMEKFNKDRLVIYNTYQLYRHDVMGRLERALDKAKTEGYYFGVKLVRGAYMEMERARALELGYDSPIHETKKGADDDFNLALKICVDNIDRVALCAGTHNEDSCTYLVNLMKKANLAPLDQRIYFAQLLGMSDNVSFKLSGLGYNVAKYVPYGPIEKVLPYLFRRAEENTSIAGQSGRELTLIRKEIQRRREKK